MYKLIRLYNQNKKKIWTIIICIILIIGLIQLLNYIVIKNNEKNINNSNNNIKTPEKTYNNINLESDKSAITGESIGRTQLEKVDIIDTFYSYCNNKNYEKAYEMLSKDCKKELYHTIDIFIDNYCNIFDVNKNISVENWIDDIFKVEIFNDMLASGKNEKIDGSQDFVTIVLENGETKLNVNGYIGRREFKEEYTENKDVKIEVLENNKYMEYETYTFQITNNSKKSILIDNLKNTSSVYLQDENDIKYFFYSHEIPLTELQLDAGEAKKITIKFYSRYSSEKRINKIVFAKVILDYEKYKNQGNVLEQYDQFEIYM